MPVQEINKAIAKLEFQVKHYEAQLDESIENNEIFSRAKVILCKLKEVSRELNELKKLKAEKDLKLSK